MKNGIKEFLIFMLIFLLVFPSSMLYATDTDEDYVLTDAEAQNLQTTNDFEAVISMFFLSVGDYAQDYISQVFKEEITVDKIVFNRAVLLNANFFNNSVNASQSNATHILREIITKWFQYFRKIALIVILICLIGVGIRHFVQTADSKVKAQDTLKKVVMAVALVYLFPYVMRYAFDINEGIIRYIGSKYSTQDKITAMAISQISDLTREDLEFRSPKYISIEGMRVGAGSSEATQLYLNRLEDYKKQVDVMRMMRAFAGVTLRFTYIIIWWIMLAQVYILAVIYIKRYLTIAFLIIIYPLVIIGYIMGGMFGKRQTAFNRWCKTFFTNVFMQSIHAVVYGAISGIIMSQVQGQMTRRWY